MYILKLHGICSSSVTLHNCLETSGYVQVRILDFDPSHYLNFEANIQFPEEEMGAVHIDMGYGSQLRLETDIPANIRLEFSLQMDLLTEAGENITTENGDTFIAVDPFHVAALKEPP